MRTFVAAWPDERTRQLLAALELGREKNLRLVGPARWHVTLRFLGEVTEAELEALGDALRAGAAALPGPAECRLGPATAWFSRVRVLQLPAHGNQDGPRNPGAPRNVRRHVFDVIPEDIRWIFNVHPDSKLARQSTCG